MAIEHYPAEHTPRGTVGRRETWDRIDFASWSPRKVWLGGRERVSLGEPTWRPMPREEVAGLIGEAEVDGGGTV